MSSISIRNEALLMLEGKGVILEVARTVSSVLEASEISGAVIYGVGGGYAWACLNHNGCGCLGA